MLQKRCNLVKTNFTTLVYYGYNGKNSTNTCLRLEHIKKMLENKATV